MINEVDRLVGQRMKARRKAMGMSQTDLANAAGVRFQQIQKYESGANRVSASRLWAIAEALNVEVVFFFEGIRPVQDQTAETPTPVDTLGFLQDKAAVEMLTMFSTLPQAQKNAVLSIVRSMIDSEAAKQPEFGS
ncbi:MAG: transcriptional regulator [Rhodobacterales bacterium]|nr:MAG: transcriptional regulator [Rhodobacterales bacterium]